MGPQTEPPVGGRAHNGAAIDIPAYGRHTSQAAKLWPAQLRAKLGSPGWRIYSSARSKLERKSWPASDHAMDSKNGILKPYIPSALRPSSHPNESAPPAAQNPIAHHMEPRSLAALHPFSVCKPLPLGYRHRHCPPAVRKRRWLNLEPNYFAATPGEGVSRWPALPPTGTPSRLPQPGAGLPL